MIAKLFGWMFSNLAGEVAELIDIEAKKATVDSAAENRLSIWTNEYDAHRSTIRNHIELQQKNVNLGIVVMSAFSGYLFNYWSRNSLQQIEETEIALIFVLAPLLGLIFVFRHINHDIIIVEVAEYIQKVVRPKLVEKYADRDLLGYEDFLASQRMRRYKRFGPFWLLGAEHIVLFGGAASFMVAAWGIYLTNERYAGEASVLYRWMLFIDSGVLALCLLMSVNVALLYRKV